MSAQEVDSAQEVLDTGDIVHAPIPDVLCSSMLTYGCVSFDRGESRRWHFVVQDEVDEQFEFFGGDERFVE